MNFEALRSGIPDYAATLERDSLLVLSQVEALSDEELIEFAQTLAEATTGSRSLLQWDFGAVMRMKYDPTAANYLFSAERVPLHWDGAFHVEPRYLLFLCDSSEGDGGETVFVNTERVIGDLDERRVLEWEGVNLTYTTEKKAHYGGKFTTAAVRRHPVHGRKILRFAECVKTDLNPVHLEIDGTEDPGRFYDELAALVSDPRYAYRHSWKPGDLVVADNHSFLHGREALGKNVGRSFRRVQLL